jgi:hypothetical protein
MAAKAAVGVGNPTPTAGGGHDRSDGRPTVAISDQQVPMVRMISLAEIHADQNVRERLVVEEVDQLAQSIALLGQLSPVSVRADADRGGYVLIAGHKRCAALTQLGRRRCVRRFAGARTGTRQRELRRTSFAQHSLRQRTRSRCRRCSTVG